MQKLQRIKYIWFVIFIKVLIFQACNKQTKYQYGNSLLNISFNFDAQKFKKYCKYTYSNAEIELLNKGLVDVNSIDSTIMVSLAYSTKDNFLGYDAYGDIEKCFLQAEVAKKLVKAQYLLKKINPSYSLKLLDCCRSHSVQQAMWDSLKMPFAEKIKFLSNPKNASLHNYAAAVDVTIFDLKENKDLDMGTPFDCMDETAYPISEAKMLEAGKISQEHINNRKLLRSVMYAAGFYNIQTEWWHFNACNRDTAKVKYNLIP